MTALMLCVALIVTDGDTISCGRERIRLFGLDCAELRRPGGAEAKRALQAMLGAKRVTFRRRGRDRYGRTVGTVYADGADVACAMIRTGACREYRRYSGGEYEECR